MDPLGPQELGPGSLEVRTSLRGHGGPNELVAHIDLKPRNSGATKYGEVGAPVKGLNM